MKYIWWVLSIFNILIISDFLIYFWEEKYVLSLWKISELNQYFEIISQTSYFNIDKYEWTTKQTKKQKYKNKREESIQSFT